jgi:hypothetical protein
MDAPDDPIVTPIALGTIGLGTQAYSSKRARDQSSAAKDRSKREGARLEGQAREQKLQGELGDSIAAERRRERARALLTSGRGGTIKTTPIGVMGDPSLAGPRNTIG